MGKLEDELEELVSFEENGGGFGAPEAREQHLLKIEHLKFQITRRDNMKIAVTSALIGAVVAAGATLLLGVLG